MKRFLVAALAGVALMGAVTEASAQRRGRTTVIESAPSSGIDANTLLLLGATGALGAGSGGLSTVLPLLLAQPTTGTTIIQESGRRRWRGPRPVVGGSARFSR